jgi:hypothetical protein
LTRKRKSPKIVKRGVKMNTQTMSHIENIKSALNSKNQFDPKKVKDDFAFRISITHVEEAIKKGLITEKQLMSILKKKV